MNVNMKRAAAAAVLCLGLTVAASAAGAQDRSAGPGGGPSRGDRAAERQKMFETFRHQREQRLHDLLQIRPDQEGALRAYLTALESQHKPGERGHGREGREGREGQDKAMTTPERLDRMAARMAERQQRFQQTAAATKTFYAALNADQRKAFDAMPRMRGGEGHGFGHGHFGGPDRGREPGSEGPPPPR